VQARACGSTRATRGPRLSDELFKEIDNAVQGGDAPRVRDLVVPLKETERRKLAKPVADAHQPLRWSWDQKQADRRRAACVAFAGTATARKLAQEAWTLAHQTTSGVDECLYDVIAARGSAFSESLARMLLRGERPLAWPLMRRAVREELIPPPEDQENYLRGMIFGILRAEAGNELRAVYRGLLDDPGLIDEVWSIFEHDLGADLAMMCAWRRTEDFRLEREENLWTYALVTLAREGRLDRERLLDASLDALTRDFRPSGIRWYAQLHEELGPTDDERRARVDRYLALLASSAPAALKAGLTGIKALGNDAPAIELARAAAPALTQPRKADAIQVLRLLESAAKNDDGARPDVLVAATEALGHEHADVQERAVKLLERYPDDAPRVELLAYVDVVSPTLRQRVEALTGVATEREHVEAPQLEELSEEAAISVRERRWPDPRVPDPTPLRPLERLESVDDLIELAASLLQGRGTGDDAERFLEGVSRLCGERPPRFKERTAGLVEQAHAPSHVFPHGTSGAQIVSIVVLSWARGTRPARAARHDLGGLLQARALEVANRARRGVPRELLSFPTHEGGWIDPERLEERDRGGGRIFNRPDPADRHAAHLRVRSGPPIELVAQQTVGRAFIYGKPPDRVGVEIGRFPPQLTHSQRVISAPLQALGRDTSEWYLEDTLWPAGDALGARWLCTLLPGNPEVQFARAMTAIVDFIDKNPYRHPEAALELMLDPSVPLRDPGWTAVAAALLAKSPDLQRIGSDIVLTAISDGRFDPGRLGAGIAWLLRAGFGTITRIEAPLRDAARMSPLHEAQVLRALEALLVAAPEGQRNLHVPLGVALDLATASRTALKDDGVRGAIARLGEAASKTSKLGKAARSLLALEGNDAALDTVLRLAAAAGAAPTNHG
jgi:hypothetical protein